MVGKRLSVIIRHGLGLFVLVVALGGGGASSLHRVVAQSLDAAITIDVPAADTAFLVAGLEIKASPPLCPAAAAVG